jgi:hypothetical protein
MWISEKNDFSFCSFRPGSAASRPMPFTFCFLRAGGADRAIDPGWSAAARRETPGNGEDGIQALEGRQIIPELCTIWFTKPFTKLQEKIRARK